MKISIIGHSGGGKSTLAAALADYYQIPLLHLDQLYFEPNWQPRPADEVLADLTHFLEEHDSWVIDGVYSRFCFGERLEQADQIIYLNFSRWSSFWRILSRYRHYKNKTRPSAPRGCPEQLDWSFLSFTLFQSRRRDRQAMYDRICQTYVQKVTNITNQRQLDQFYHLSFIKNPD